MTLSRDKKRLPQPSDWVENDGWGFLLVCVPDSDQWRGMVKGQLEDLGRAWSYRLSTGTIADTIQTGRQIMACDFDLQQMVDKLQCICDAVLAGAGSNGESGSAGAGSIDAPSTSEQDNGIDPPSGFGSYSEYEDYKCRWATYAYDRFRADVNIVALEYGSGKAFELWLAVIVVAVAGALAFSALVGIFVLIGAVVAAGITVANLNDIIDSAEADAICALFTATDLAEAQSELNAVIDTSADDELGGVLGPIAADYLKAFWTTDILNELFEEVSIPAAYDNADCADCLLCPDVANVNWGTPIRIDDLGSHAIVGEYDGSKYRINLHFGQKTTGGTVIPDACGPARNITINSWDNATKGALNSIFRQSETEFQGGAGPSDPDWDVTSNSYLTGPYNNTRTIYSISETAFTLNLTVNS